MIVTITAVPNNNTLYHYLVMLSTTCHDTEVSQRSVDILTNEEYLNEVTCNIPVLLQMKH